jgi:hypothetical protein
MDQNQRQLMMRMTGLLCKWKTFFDLYRKYGRWYQPDVNKTINDTDLNNFERENRAFLKKQYLDEYE